MNTGDDFSNTYSCINQAKEQLQKLMRDSNIANSNAMKSVISMLDQQEEVFSQILKKMTDNHEEVLEKFESLKISISSHQSCKFRDYTYNNLL